MNDANEEYRKHINLRVGITVLVLLAFGLGCLVGGFAKRPRREVVIVQGRVLRYVTVVDLDTGEVVKSTSSSDVADIARGAVTP